MPTRITHLTDKQKAAIPDHVKKWIQIGWCTDEADWAKFEDGCERCYGYAGIPWHGNVIRVGNPLVLALAAPIASYLLRPVRGAVRGAVDGAVHAPVGDAVHVAVRDAVRDAVHVAVHGAVGVAVGGAVRGAVGGAVVVAVGGAVDGAVHDAVGVAVGDAVRDAVGDAVDGAVGDAVRYAVRGAVDGAVGGAVDGAVHDAVGDAVGGAVRDAVGDAVGGAVRDAVGDAVRYAVRGAVHDHWWRYLGGHWWVNWPAWTNFFRDVCDLQLPDDLWNRDQAYATTQSSAGWWWPSHRFCMVTDRPRQLHLEQVSTAGWGSHRLHNETGPAIKYADGWALHYWHGTRVPADLIEGEGWAPDRILTERNTEVRRCAIERVGWDRFITTAELKPVGAAVPDPGNPGQHLRLYDLPPGLADLYDQPARILLMANASLDRDGTRRKFGEPVPAHHTDPIAAAAEQFGIPRDEYTSMSRAT